MKFALIVAACHPVDGSILHNPKTHVPRLSTGCGSSSPYPSGTTSVATGTYGGVKYTYRVYVPTTYDKSKPMPLVTQHHGWGCSAKYEESGSGITIYAEKYGYIAVYPQGSNDNTHKGGPWYSWNAAGTTLSPNPVATCTNQGASNNYCYESCYDGGTSCSDKPQCWWTTCNNEVTPSGTGFGNVTGFVPALYNTLESQLCVDTTREFAAGESNGGLMTYQLGVDMADRLAAVVPEFGSFHAGHAEAPKTPVPILEFHGTKDTTVPGNVSASGDGYFYTTTEDIFYGSAYSSGWRVSNGCSGSISHYPTSFDGQYDLWCMSTGTCTGGDVVRCAWDGGHNWYGNNPTSNGGLVSEFLMKWTKPTHVGFGCVQGESCADAELLEDVEIVEDEDEPDSSQSLPIMLNSGNHYHDPHDGCEDDEDVLDLGLGHVCSFRVGTIGTEEVSGVPIANCSSIGNIVPEENNGCPYDVADLPPLSKAFPTCLAKGNTSNPYHNKEFHCVLVCPCDMDEEGGCGDAAHAHCPGQSTCQRGELRHRGKGVCTFDKSQTINV